MQVKLSPRLPASGGFALVAAIRSSKLPMYSGQRIFLSSAEVTVCAKGACGELQFLAGPLEHGEEIPHLSGCQKLYCF